MKIGFIGQGFIGRNYADDFEHRGFKVIRYSQEEPHIQNKDRISECDIVFIAVPTPTTSEGFDGSIVESVLPLIGEGKIAVIKSTVLPGTTEAFQKKFPEIFVLHSPEFLREVTAIYDAANPDRNIVGVPIENDEYKTKAQAVLDVLPKAPYELICKSRESELIKYASNCFLFTKVIFMNMLYDVAQKEGLSWEILKSAIVADPRIGKSHMDPVGKDLKRGAGGHCFVKDFKAFADFVKQNISDDGYGSLLNALEQKNIELLKESGKDQNLLEAVYGNKI